MVPLLLAFGGVSVAGTLSSVGFSSSGMFNGGTPTGCGDSSATTAYCSFYANNFDQYGGEGVSGNASASSAFGTLSGNAQAEASQSLFGYNGVIVQGGFTAEFNDPVLVTGVSGTGTLVADFSWNAEAYAVPSGEQFWASFTAGVGSSSDSWTATGNLPYAPYVCQGSTMVPCTGAGTVDVSSSFTFGGLTDVSGSTTADINTQPINIGMYGEQLGYSSSSLTVTFLVYDAAGNLVPGAVVTPVLTSTPEPGSISLLLCGALVLGVPFARSTSKNRPHNPAVHS
jgi:hypothetical protein